MYASHLDNNIERVLSPQTKKLYIQVIKRFLAENEQILSTERVNEYIKDRSDVSTVHYVRYPFKKLFEMLGRPFDWTVIVRTAKKAPKRPHNYVKWGTLNELIMAINGNKWKLVALLQKETGARASEVIGLRGQDLVINGENDAEIHFWDRKGKKERIIYLHPDVAGYLMGINDRKWLFMTDKEYNNEEHFLRALRTQYIYYWRAVKKAALKVGIPGFSTHDFRRNMARRIYTSTKDAFATQKFLGHANMDTTERYIGDIRIDTKAILMRLRLTEEETEDV